MVAAFADGGHREQDGGGFLGALSRKMLSGEKFFFQTLRASRGRAKSCWRRRYLAKSCCWNWTASMSTWCRKTAFWAGADGVKIEKQDAKPSRAGCWAEKDFHFEDQRHRAVGPEQFQEPFTDRPETERRIHRGQQPPGGLDLTTTYNIEKASSGWIASLTSGEGLVCRFHRAGRRLHSKPQSRQFWQLDQTVHPGFGIATVQHARARRSRLTTSATYRCGYASVCVRLRPAHNHFGRRVERPLHRR